MEWIILIIIGLVAGLSSGLVGIGGGIVIVPALVMIFGFDQKMAQGTALALMIPPVGIFAVMEYYKQGNVNISAAGFIIAGFIVGGFFGAKYLTYLSSATVSRVFAFFLILVAVKLLTSTRV